MNSTINRSRKIYTIILPLLVILVSILVMIIPTFLTTGVSRITTSKEINLPLILNDEKDIKLIFFGYSGCSDICTPRLLSIAKFYRTLNKEIKNRVGVEFLDISIPNDETLPKRFAEFFNPSFKGIYLSKDTLRDYTKEFKVFFSQSLIDKTEYDHTVNLYLVKKENNKKILRYIYNAFPFDYKQIKLDIKELLNE